MLKCAAEVFLRDGIDDTVYFPAEDTGNFDLHLTDVTRGTYLTVEGSELQGM